MILKCLRSAIIGLERADFPMPGDVHDAENVGAVVQGRCDEAGAQAVTREESRINSTPFSEIMRFETEAQADAESRRAAT